MDTGQGQGVLGLDAENAARLAAAYQRAVSILSLNDRALMPPPASRAAILRAMLRHGLDSGFNEHGLTLAGLASAESVVTRTDTLRPIASFRDAGAALRQARGIRLPQQAA